MHAFWLVLTYDLLGDRRIDDVIIKPFFNSLLYKTNRSQVAMRLFSNRSQRTSKCGKNISDTLGCASCATFLFLSHLTSSVIYYWTEAWQLGIYLLNIQPKFELLNCVRKSLPKYCVLLLNFGMKFSTTCWKDKEFHKFYCSYSKLTQTLDFPVYIVSAWRSTCVFSFLM